MGNIDMRILNRKEIYDFIMDNYNLPERVYHGPYHITSMLREYQQNHQNIIDKKPIDNYYDYDTDPHLLCFWSILYHDIVYDKFDQKEERSSSKFLQDHQLIVENPNLLNNIVDCINMTKSHKLVDNSVEYDIAKNTVVLLDLFQLTDSEKVERNWYLLSEESIRIYDIDQKTFAIKNLEYMEVLYDTMEENKPIYRERKNNYGFDENVLTQIQKGIKQTMQLSANKM